MTELLPRPTPQVRRSNISMFWLLSAAAIISTCGLGRGIHGRWRDLEGRNNHQSRRQVFKGVFDADAPSNENRIQGGIFPSWRPRSVA